jgi:hypothetical protein
VHAGIAPPLADAPNGSRNAHGDRHAHPEPCTRTQIASGALDGARIPPLRERVPGGDPSAAHVA